MGQRVVFLQVPWQQAGQPVVFVGSKDPIGGTCLGQDFTPLEHHMVFAGLKAYPGISQGAAYPGIARQ